MLQLQDVVGVLVEAAPHWVILLSEFVDIVVIRLPPTRILLLRVICLCGSIWGLLLFGGVVWVHLSCGWGRF